MRIRRSGVNSLFVQRRDMKANIMLSGLVLVFCTLIVPVDARNTQTFEQHSCSGAVVISDAVMYQEGKEIKIEATVHNQEAYPIWVLIKRMDLNNPPSDSDPESRVDLGENIRSGCGAFPEYPPPANARFVEISSQDKIRIIFSVNSRRKGLWGFLKTQSSSYLKVYLKTVIFKAKDLDDLKKYKYETDVGSKTFDINLFWLCGMQMKPLSFIALASDRPSAKKAASHRTD
mgnify:CR=1 FL=1